MTYKRVIPRDLFNEASLRKMLGALWIKLENLHPDYSASFPNVERLGGNWPGRFEIEQSPSNGSISLTGFSLVIGGKWFRLERPLSSREPWPLYAVDDDDNETEVFDELGELSPEFLDLIRKG